ncbi:MAG TPA: glycosyltransferase [Chitinophagaceae bacterium]|nr:glycosyltransferase [Chitinophagaceae bacterium]
MGLSILIPVYNFNVTSLVQALRAQLASTEKEGEIILWDDGSDKFVLTANQSLENIQSVLLYKNEKNEGRMLTRQRLSGLARYDYLLFLDCDSKIIKDDFLSAYFDLIKEDINLASGGRVYADAPPAECDLMLHWKYGRKRESKPRPGAAFMSNNFLIKKEIFKNLDTSLKLAGYGHEDSWWGIQFEQAGISCRYINNPVLHAAIEKADVYIEKSEMALSNLLLLEKKIDKNMISRHVRIFRWYRRLKTTGLSGLYLFFEKIFHRSFRGNLLSCKPSLFFFDCYRLAALIRMAKQNKEG